jgi:integrase
MPKAPKSELKPVKVGPIEIPLYRYKDGRTVFADTFGGPRKIRSFTDESRARAEAEKVALRAIRGETIRHELRPSDIDAFRRMLQICQPFDIAPTVALEEWAAAKAICGEVGILQAAKTGMASLRISSKTVPEVISSYMEHLRYAALSVPYIETREDDLILFRDDFKGDIAAITPDDIKAWLAKRDVGPRRRNNLRAALVSLFIFARDKKWLPNQEKTAPEFVPRIKIRRGTIEVWTPSEIRFWLQHIQQEMLPWLVLTSFSGIRSEEVCPPAHYSHKDRLRWEDFHWGKKVIIVREDVTKTRRRMVPMLDNLIAWLLPWRNARGPVIPEGRRYDNEVRRLKKLSASLTKKAKADPLNYHHPIPGLTWRRNAHRHSYGSYRMAMVKNAGQVREEMGNSIAMIDNNYNEPQFEEDALHWFSVFPDESAANVLQLPLSLAS